MKKLFCVLALVAVLLCSGCTEVIQQAAVMVTDQTVASLGKYQSREYYSSGGFQDFTDYGKYTYQSVNFEGNPYFRKLTAQSEEAFLSHLEDFENWIRVIGESEPNNEVVKGYDFDPAVISQGDYLYIFDDPDYPAMGCYNLYLFDSETMTLYYFHTNI